MFVVCCSIRCLLHFTFIACCLLLCLNKNSSGDEIANVNFYAVSALGRYPNSLK